MRAACSCCRRAPWSRARCSGAPRPPLRKMSRPSRLLDVKAMTDEWEEIKEMQGAGFVQVSVDADGNPSRQFTDVLRAGKRREQVRSRVRKRIKKASA